MLAADVDLGVTEHIAGARVAVAVQLSVHVEGDAFALAPREDEVMPGCDLALELPTERLTLTRLRRCFGERRRNLTQ